MSFDVVLCNTFIHPDVMLFIPEGQKMTEGFILIVPERDIRIGGGAYTGIMMSSLGMKCCLIDKIGSDIFGDFTRKEMERYGLNMSHVTLTEGHHMFCVGFVQTGTERKGDTFACYIPPNMAISSLDEAISMVQNAPPAKLLYAVTWFWSFVFPTLMNTSRSKIFEAAKQRGYAIALDINYKPAGSPPEQELEDFKQAMKYVDILMPNLRDAEAIVGKKPIEETVADLLALGPKIVGLKAGGQGCYVATQQGGSMVPPIKVDVIDPSGAGDMFGAAFSYGWLQGWEPTRIASFAGAAAAWGISHETKDKYPTLHELESFWKEHAD